MADALVKTRDGVQKGTVEALFEADALVKTRDANAKGAVPQGTLGMPFSLQRILGTLPTVSLQRILQIGNIQKE